MKVIGIDVAPGKGGHVCDGKEVLHKSPPELETYLESLPQNVIVAWDSPLTGPSNPDAALKDKDLTCRRIESFFSKKGNYKAPPGISIRPYGGCSHWTISRRILGLPRIGRFDDTTLPFALIACEQVRPKTGRHVIEVHPAVALWQWFESKHKGPWNYKSDNDCLRQLAGLMTAKFDMFSLQEENDDHLDAWIAWLLARLWLDNNGVMLLGNPQTGSFLLPHDSIMKEDFDAFASV